MPLDRIAEQAEVGFSEDRYGWQDPWDCNRTFGGGTYAGLWANLRCVEGAAKAADRGTGQTHLHIIPVGEAPTQLIRE